VQSPYVSPHRALVARGFRSHQKLPCGLIAAAGLRAAREAVLWTLTLANRTLRPCVVLHVAQNSHMTSLQDAQIPGAEFCAPWAKPGKMRSIVNVLQCSKFKIQKWRRPAGLGGARQASRLPSWFSTCQRESQLDDPSHFRTGLRLGGVVWRENNHDLPEFCGTSWLLAG
jgi:hypothetical protein